MATAILLKILSQLAQQESSQGMTSSVKSEPATSFITGVDIIIWVKHGAQNLKGAEQVLQ